MATDRRSSTKKVEDGVIDEVDSILIDEANLLIFGQIERPQENIKV